FSPNPNKRPPQLGTIAMPCVGNRIRARADQVPAVGSKLSALSRTLFVPTSTPPPISKWPAPSSAAAGADRGAVGGASVVQHLVIGSKDESPAPTTYTRPPTRAALTDPS